MAKVTLDIDHSALHQVGMAHAFKLVTDVTRGTLNRSAVLVPVDNGPLRASGGMRVQSLSTRVVGEVEYDAEYAAAVHNGRRELTIRAKKPNGRLRFTVGGRVVYARSVTQPARAGRPYLATALQEVAGAAGFQVSIG